MASTDGAEIFRSRQVYVPARSSSRCATFHFQSVRSGSRPKAPSSAVDGGSGVSGNLQQARFQRNPIISKACKERRSGRRRLFHGVFHCFDPRRKLRQQLRAVHPHSRLKCVALPGFAPRLVRNISKPKNQSLALRGQIRAPRSKCRSPWTRTIWHPSLVPHSLTAIAQSFWKTRKGLQANSVY